MTTSPTEIHDIWRPHPDSISDLIVEDCDEGFNLSAPDGTECAEWLWYYSQSEELHEKFETAFTQMLSDYLTSLKNQHGSAE
jgi:hypothetical protein